MEKLLFSLIMIPCAASFTSDPDQNHMGFFRFQA